MALSKHYFTAHYYTAEALQGAYRDLAKEHHPDTANQVMQKINAEYETLKQQFERQGVAGWSVPKVDAEHKDHHQRVNQDNQSRQQSPRDNSGYDSDVNHHAQMRDDNHSGGWTWEQINAESNRYNEKFLQHFANNHIIPM